MRKSYVVTLLAALLWVVVAFALHDYWRKDRQVNISNKLPVKILKFCLLKQLKDKRYSM
ncbi:hypothetical protein JCM19052_2099 [Vibrio sp. JCM 19052]|nr:hypothetical protein JCM19052_2099 [Vibrio sp. JCM 19052]